MAKNKTYEQLRIENEALKKQIAEYKKIERKYEEAREKYESLTKELQQLRDKYKACYNLYRELLTA